MKGILAFVALLVTASCAPIVGQKVNADFSVPADADIARSLDIRSRYQLPTPSSDSIIYVDSVTEHHTRGEASTIVWRDKDGSWKRSQVAETSSGLLKMKPILSLNENSVFSKKDSQDLDKLTASRSLYDKKVTATGATNVGQLFHVMVIVSPKGRTTIRWGGRLMGEKGALADIVLGR